MQKVLFVYGICALIVFTYWKTAVFQPVVDDLVLSNVEALADPEYTVPRICEDSGDVTCPINGKKVWIVIEQGSISPDEEAN